MKQMKKLLLIALLVGLMGTLSACSSDFDAKGMVESYMELLTTGETDNYRKYTGQTAEEAEADYQEFVDSIQSSLATVDGVSDETVSTLTDAFIQLISKCKYEVSDAAKVDDDYELTITMYPIQGVFTDLVDSIDNEIVELMTSNPDMTTEELYDYIFSRMAETITANLDNITYGDAQTIDLKVVKNDDNTYQIENDYEIGQQIGTYIFDQSELE